MKFADVMTENSLAGETDMVRDVEGQTEPAFAESASLQRGFSKAEK
jgi:hypothetical protein